MPNMNYPESDWKLFKAKIPGWQEAYMERFCKEYVGILCEPASSANRFWKIEKRIKNDKKKVGVIAEMRRFEMFNNIVSLIREGAITSDDLEGFSEEIVQAAINCSKW